MMIGMTPSFLHTPSHQEGELGAVYHHQDSHDGDEQPRQPGGLEELPVGTLVIRDHDADPADEGRGGEPVAQRPEQGQSGDGEGSGESNRIQVPDQRDPQDGGGSIGQDPLGNGDDNCQRNEKKNERDADHSVGQQAADTGGGHDLLEHPDNDNGGDEGEKTFNGLPGQRQNIYFAGTEQPGDQSGQGKLQWQPEERRLEREDTRGSHRAKKDQKGKEHPPPAHSGRYFGHFLERRGQVYRPFLSPATYKHGEDTAYQDGHGKRKLKHDIGDGRPGAENHGPDVDRGSRGARLLLWKARMVARTT